MRASRLLRLIILPMSQTQSDRLRSEFGFAAPDVLNVHALREHLLPILSKVVDRFYARLFQDPEARAVFTGGEEQMARQRRVFSEWVSDLFTGDYGAEYIERHLRIGQAHVRVGLSQHYMVLGIEWVWTELGAAARRLKIPAVESKLSSLHKLLMFELAVMLESYRESYSNEIRKGERDAVEERLTQAEHMAEIGRLATALAHEVKNPLAGISGAIQIIGDAMASDNPHRPIIHEILGQIRRLDATVRDLLLYSRPLPSKPSVVSLRVVVDRVLTVLHEEPAMHRVRIEPRISRHAAHVVADEGQVEQMLINLLLNAAHASRDGDVIRVTTSAANGMVRLSVEDEGQGMPPEIRARAFEPFFTTKAKGTGLGLAICRRIVEALGGRISLESAVGRGTTVSVDLPRDQQLQSE